MSGTIRSRAVALWSRTLDGAKAVSVAVWTAFWANVVSIHLATGSLFDAGMTALLLVGPVLALVAWRLAARIERIDVEASPVERVLSG